MIAQFSPAVGRLESQGMTDRTLCWTVKVDQAGRILKQPGDLLINKQSIVSFGPMLQLGLDSKHDFEL